MTRKLLSAAIVAALGGLLFGFDTAVISGAEGMLRDLYDPQYAALIGTILGAIVFAKPADSYGRRPMLLCMGLLYFVSAVGSALAWGAPPHLLAFAS